MHYVGYVEEDETPSRSWPSSNSWRRSSASWLRRRRLRRRRLQGAAEADDDGADVARAAKNPEDEDLEEFDQALLEKVFARTSKFSLKRALADDLYGDDEDQLFDSDDDEAADLENIFGGWGKKKRRLKGAPREPRAPRAPKPQKSHMITAYNSDNQMLLRKKKIVDPRAPNILKLPPHPIPVSWGRVIKPFVPKRRRSRRRRRSRIARSSRCPFWTPTSRRSARTSSRCTATRRGRRRCNPDRGDVLVDQIATIPFQKLAPYGFVFMWVEKENLSAVCDAMLKKSFVYVENLTWVQQRPNNTIANSAAEYVCRSHRTMLMFRRDVRQFPEAKEVELRHQRNADCTLDVTCTTASGRRKVPEHVYKAMETLLPEAYAPGSRGRLLELWAEPGAEARRSGWTLVADGKGKGK
jgi:N6-adenosine-specific RNA methylase IME4